MYSVAIIEDCPLDYNSVKEKLLSKQQINFVTEIQPITADTSLKTYVENLLKYQADIYIVDWELQFLGGIKSPRDIFDALSKRKFDFINKYWVFYSGKHDSQSAMLLSEYFPLNYNYVLPGKGHIVGPIPKSGRDYLQECLDTAQKFLDTNTTPNWVSSINFETEVLLENFNGKCFNLKYQVEDENKLHQLSLDAEGVICMSIDDPLAILIFIEKESKTLQCYLFRFNRDAKKVSTSLGLRESRGFRYNPAYFDDEKILKEQYRPYVNSKAHMLYGAFKDPQNPADRLNLAKQLKILTQHKVLK